MPGGNATASKLSRAEAEEAKGKVRFRGLMQRGYRRFQILLGLVLISALLEHLFRRSIFDFSLRLCQLCRTEFHSERTDKVFGITAFLGDKYMMGILLGTSYMFLDLPKATTVALT